MRVFNETVGAQLASWRKTRGLSQQELAEQLGIKMDTLAGYEKGNVSISLFMLLRCAALLQVSFADIVGPLQQKAQRTVNGGVDGFGKNLLVSRIGNTLQLNTFAGPPKMRPIAKRKLRCDQTASLQRRKRLRAPIGSGSQCVRGARRRLCAITEQQRGDVDEAVALEWREVLSGRLDRDVASGRSAAGATAGHLVV